MCGHSCTSAFGTIKCCLCRPSVFSREFCCGIYGIPTLVSCNSLCVPQKIIEIRDVDAFSGHPTFSRLPFCVATFPNSRSRCAISFFFFRTDPQLSCSKITCTRSLLICFSQSDHNPSGDREVVKKQDLFAGDLFAVSHPSLLNFVVLITVLTNIRNCQFHVHGGGNSMVGAMTIPLRNSWCP
jgi:hypothetical protein